MKKRVVIVDEHAALRQMMAQVLVWEKNYEIVGELEDGRGALEVCRRLTPDVLILELALPGLCGREVLRRVRDDFPKLRTLVFSGTRDHQLIREVLRYRPHGFVDKRESLPTFLEALNAVAAGRSYFSAFASGMLTELSVGGANPLTAREVEVLQLVAESRSSKEIASHLGLSPKTVENHRARIMEKLRLHDTAGLTRYAMRSGLVAV